MAARNDLAVLDLDTPGRTVYRLIKSDVAHYTLPRPCSLHGVWKKADGMAG